MTWWSRATAPAPEDRFPSAASLEEALAGQGAGAAEPAARCALCGGPDPFAAGLCPGCGGGSDGAGETLVVLQRPVGGGAVATARSLLATILPGAGQDAEAAARGERALFRTSADAARRIVEQLGLARARRARGADDTRGRAAAGVLPSHVGSSGDAGAAAGMSAAPSLRWVTPIFAGLLLPERPPGRRHAAGERNRPERRTAARHRAATHRDTGRSATRDGARPARRSHPPGPHGVGRASPGRHIADAAPALGELLLAGADAAADLALLDESLGRFERQRERLAAQTDGWADALARCERARDALVQRLLDAMTVLGRLQGQAAELGGKDLALDETVAALRAEAEAQQAAAQEIATLLGSPGA